MKLRELLDDLRRHDSILWRRAISAGVAWGPDLLTRRGPPLFGVAAAALLPRQRRAVRDNLRRILGPRPRALEIAGTARVFAACASCLTDAFIAAGGRGERVRARCLDDASFVDARSDGRGVIFATAHTGGWQILGAALEALHDAPVVVVMRRERDARAQALQESVRERAGVRVVYVGDDPLAALPLLPHLRAQGLCAMQIDRLPRGMRGRKGELFGEPFWIPEGPLRLAAAVSGAPIVPVFTRRLGYMEYDVRVSPPIRLPRRPSAAELDAAAHAVLRAMESFVRANPTQWFHFE